MATRTPYFEKGESGNLKVRFTMDEAKTIVKELRLVNSSSGYIGKRDDLVSIEKYNGRYGEGFSLHYGSFKRKDGKTFHYVDYYCK